MQRHQKAKGNRTSALFPAVVSPSTTVLSMGMVMWLAVVPGMDMIVRTVISLVFVIMRIGGTWVRVLVSVFVVVLMCVNMSVLVAVF